MIDPAIIDLMHQMSRQPPQLVQEARAVPHGTARAETWARTTGERNVRALEQETARWIAETERQVRDLVQAFAEAGIQGHHLSQLDQVITINERMLDADAKLYGRIVKQGRRLAQQARSVSLTFSGLFEAHRDRCLRSLARWGVARAEFILVLRSLRAEYDPAGRDGPVFNDPKALGDYLRAAVA